MDLIPARKVKVVLQNTMEEPFFSAAFCIHLTGHATLKINKQTNELDV
jgi:uncharacterized lipoprotein YajG